MLPPPLRASCVRLPPNPMRLVERDIDACTHAGRLPGDMGYEHDPRTQEPGGTVPPDGAARPRRRTASGQSMEAVR